MLIFIFHHGNRDKSVFGGERFLGGALCPQSVTLRLLSRCESRHCSRNHDGSTKMGVCQRQTQDGGMVVISAAMSMKTTLAPCHASITPHCAKTSPTTHTRTHTHSSLTSSADRLYTSEQSVTAQSRNGWPLELKLPQQHINYPSAPSWPDASVHHTPAKSVR